MNDYRPSDQIERPKVFWGLEHGGILSVSLGDNGPKAQLRNYELAEACVRSRFDERRQAGAIQGGRTFELKGQEERENKLETFNISGSSMAA